MMPLYAFANFHFIRSSIFSESLWKSSSPATLSTVYSFGCLAYDALCGWLGFHDTHLNCFSQYHAWIYISTLFWFLSQLFDIGKEPQMHTCENWQFWNSWFVLKVKFYVGPDDWCTKIMASSQLCAKYVLLHMIIVSYINFWFNCRECNRLSIVEILIVKD